MLTLKKFLLVLLFSVVLCLVVSKPGANELATFYSYNMRNFLTTSTFIEYPPAKFIILSAILNDRPIDFKKTTPSQPAWYVSKIVVFAAYLVSLLAFLNYSKIVNNKISKLDAALFFSGSISIMYISMALNYFSIFSLPFLIFSLLLLYKKKYLASLIILIISILFNWMLLICGPVYLVILIKEAKLAKYKKYLYSLVYIFFNLIILKYYLSAKNIIRFPITQSMSLASIVGLLRLIGRKKLSPSLLKILSIIALVLIIVGVWQTKSFQLIRWIMFLIPYILFLLKLSKLHKINFTNILSTLLACLYLFMVVSLNYSPANLIFLSLANLLLYVHKKTKQTFYNLFAINLLVCFVLFIKYGTTGIQHVLGIFFNSFIYIFTAILFAFAIYQIIIIYKNHMSAVNKYSRSFIEKYEYFLIFVFILFNIALIPAVGSSDHISWTQYALATTSYANPFRAYTDVILQYPPLSIVIIGVFSNLWKLLIGISPDYTIAVKLSVFVFYSLTIYSLIRFTRGNKRIKPVDKLLIILSSIGLLIQTQGLNDLNIYVLPTLFAGIYFLNKKQIFLSGFLMGVTLSIKWQPIILLPLFALFIIKEFSVRKIKIEKLVKFITGFLIIPSIVWGIALVQDNGVNAVVRAFKFVINGAAAFSGQALNLNWLITYALHILNPDKYFSLEYLHGLNRIVSTYDIPWYLRGYLFFIAVILILYYYYKAKNNSLINFNIASMMIFFSHHQLNKSAYEKHLFYVLAFMLFIYLLKPQKSYRLLLILLDLMVVINIAAFYGFTGSADFTISFLGSDITLLFSFIFFLIYLYTMWRYLRFNFKFK